MTNVTITLQPEEFERILIALDWYMDDRMECSKAEASSLYDAGAEESLAAADEAAKLLRKLQNLH
ncbi:MAG: hypothetical protein JSR55_04190 [Proteobacteria bacterium]|nr:hypothetical protein [Pseudomonadota bacterium]